MSSKEKSPASKRHQDYDNIIKETMESIGGPILRKLVGIDTNSLQNLEKELPRTIVRRTDFLKRAIDIKDGVQKIFHIEFQTKVHAKMLERMLVYYSLFWEREKLPVEQYVIYLGPGKWTAPIRLKQKRLNFCYEVICINQIDYQVFLQSEQPEEVILAILANFGKKGKTEAITDILDTLKSKSSSLEQLQKLVTELEILSNIRNLQSEIIKILHHMPITLDLRKDLRFLEGKQEGRKEVREEIRKEVREEVIEEVREEVREDFLKKAIRSLLRSTDMSCEQIASELECNIHFVERVKNEMQ